MSGREREYASVPERITWTTGFRCATDKHVLGALSTFASFKTGQGAKVTLKKLIARAGMKPRTVERALHRLEADGWILAARQHRRPTAWTICTERLATNWVGAKVVATDNNLTATSGGQEAATDNNLTDNGGGQDPILTATSGGQIPCTYDPQDERDPRYNLPSPAAPGSVPLLKTTPADGAAGESPASEPYQPTLGPLDISPGDHWSRVAEIFRDHLRRQSMPADKLPRTATGKGT